MRKKLKQMTMDALSSVLPITAIVLLLSVTIAPMPVGTLMLFIVGALFLVVGMGLFSMGADMSMMPMGRDIGVKMTTTKKLIWVVAVSFTMGVIITLAEPDLQVLAQLVPGVPNLLLIVTVAVGVGLFFVASILRVLFRVRLSMVLIICYLAVILLSIFTPDAFVAVAFDSGGVTTGPITVPFIMAMGLGLASIRGDAESMDDSFGFIALCSIGPILAVEILGICFHPESAAYVAPVIPEIITSRDVTVEFLHGIPEYMIEVARSVGPILGVMVVFQLLTRRYRFRQFLRIGIGFLYTLAGLVLFFTGVNVGFIPVGQILGSDLANMSAKWLLVPLGAVIGYFIVAAEPAVHVLKKQVEEVSDGAIPGSTVQQYLSIGTAAALAIAMLRVLTGISIYWCLIPGYALAIVLTFFSPAIFTGIAFDSGGVVSGPMTSTFLLPFAIGACTQPERIMLDAFGLVAMIAMTPLVTIQIMGIVSDRRLRKAKAGGEAESFDDAIVEYEEDVRLGE